MAAPPKYKIQPFGSKAYPPSRAVCPVCTLVVSIQRAVAPAALKGKLVTAPHDHQRSGMRTACKGSNVRVELLSGEMD